MRAAIYARLSRTTEASTSIERQVRDARRFIESKGWELIGEPYVDEDVSGATAATERPALGALLEAVAERKVDVVVSWKVDRLARSVVDFHRTLETLQEHGATYASVTEPFDLTSPLGRAMAGVSAIFAELERETIRARVRSARQANTAAGKWTGGHVPTGWRAVKGPKGFRLVPSPRAKAVRTAVDTVLAGGSLAEASRASGLNRKTLPGLLRHPVLFGGHQDAGRPVRGEDGEPITPHEGIMSHGEWAQLQRALEGLHRGPQRSRRSPLLAGLVECQCGATMVGATTPERSHRGRRMAAQADYRCPKPPGSGCPGNTIRQEAVHALVLGEVLSRFGSFPVLRLVDAGGSVDRSEELAAVEESLRALDADRYERGLFQGDAGARDFAAIRSRLEAKRSALEAEQEDAEARWEPTGETFGEVLEHGDEEAKRSAVASLLARVVVSPGRKGGRRLSPEERVELEPRIP